MSDTISQVHKKKAQKTANVSWQDIEGIISNIFHKIENIKFDYVYGIPRGGLIPAVMMSHALNIPLLTDISKHNGKKILIVDDINDSGTTLRIQQAVFNMFNIDVVVVTLFKREGSKYVEFYTGQKIEHNNWLCFPWEK